MASILAKWIETLRINWMYEDDEEEYINNESEYQNADSMIDKVEILEEAAQNSGHIIAFMSGKGGVGKTGLAINVANFCAENGAKVLLVDCDLNTNGATTFFQLSRNTRMLFRRQQDVLTMHEVMSTILDKVEMGTAEEQNGFALLPINIKKNLDFIPAGNDNHTYGDYKYEGDKSPQIEAELLQYFSNWKNNYELIILDFGAGEGTFNSLLSRIVNKICIVMTPDALSRQAVRKQLGFLFKQCNLDNIVCCINMLTPYKRTVNGDALFNEFPGFQTSDDYARIYKRGNLIPTSNRELYSCLSNIVKKVYDDSTNVLSSYYKTQGNFNVEIEESNDEVIEKVANKYFLSLGISVLLHFVVFLFGAILIRELNAWEKVSMLVYIGIVSCFGIIETFFVIKLHGLWKKII